MLTCQMCARLDSIDYVILSLIIQTYKNSKTVYNVLHEMLQIPIPHPQCANNNVDKRQGQIKYTNTVRPKQTQLC